MADKKVKFEKILRKTQAELKSYVETALRSLRYKVVVDDGFVYAPGKLPVMLVAHLDTVHKTPVQQIFYTKDGKRMLSPQGIGGDDRCGVYMILEIVKYLNCHVLFCEDEEIGGIGANKFTKSGIIPEINYIIELDRMGRNDAVFYDCENDEFTKFVTSFGFKEQYGSFSDISFLAPDLGVAAVNLSSGYFAPHTLLEQIDLSIMDEIMEKTMKMIQAKTEKYIYVEKVHLYKGWGNYGYMDTDWTDDDAVAAYWAKKYGANTGGWSEPSPHGKSKYGRSLSNIKDQDYYNSLYTSTQVDYAKMIAVKLLDEHKYYPVTEGVIANSCGSALAIGEDDMCYEYYPELDAIVYIGEAVLGEENTIVLFDDVVGVPLLCELVTEEFIDEILYSL